jgi:hypothetical protein
MVLPPDLVEMLRRSRWRPFATSPDEIVWMGRVPARVDLLLSIPGAEFATAWDRRVDLTVEGVTVRVIGREDLLANKRAAGRPRDLKDVRAIERAAANAARRGGRP